MSLATVNPMGNDASSLGAALREVQNLRVSVVAGAAAGTKMNIAAIRVEDTIVSALIEDTTTGVVSADDAANITIQGSKATGTLTVDAVVNGNSAVVNGVTYTFKTTPTLLNHVRLSALTAGVAQDAANAVNLAAAINAYESRYGTEAGGTGFGTPAVVATSAAAIVTITSSGDGVGGGPVVTDTGTTITISNTDPAAVTATFVSAANTDAVTVNGVTFTIKTTPLDTDRDVGVEATDALQAAEIARAINAYEEKFSTLKVVALSILGVLTIIPKARSGNILTLTGTATRLAASGSGYLAGGTATGGIKSTTNLTGKALLVHWFDKNL